MPDEKKDQPWAESLLSSATSADESKESEFIEVEPDKRASNKKKLPRTVKRTIDAKPTRIDNTDQEAESKAQADAEKGLESIRASLSSKQKKALKRMEARDRWERNIPEDADWTKLKGRYIEPELLAKPFIAIDKKRKNLVATPKEGKAQEVMDNFEKNPVQGSKEALRLMNMVSTDPEKEENKKPAKAKASTETKPKKPKEISLSKVSHTPILNGPVPWKPTEEDLTVKIPTRARKYVKVIPLGGLGEVGKNLTVYETAKDIIIVDCGISFPDEDMLGIDKVIPDMTYLDKKKDKVRGIVITHGHEDHVGGVPYLLNKVDAPVYGSALTLGILEKKLNEKSMLSKTELHIVSAGQNIRLGTDFKVDFIHVNHSVADSLALCITTPVGKIVHTGDFKIDYTPPYEDITDLTTFGILGREGVKLLLMDSTNAEKAGKTNSEKTIYASFDEMFQKYSTNRMTFATFSTNTNRIQTILNLAHKYGRKVVLTGRSMINIVDIAIERGYIKVPHDILRSVDLAESLPPEETVILTTGSQGESLSALSRMASGEHKKVFLTSDDVVVLSAHAIPGNEKAVDRIINSLLDLGVNVIHDKYADVHVSGHACQDELSLMLTLLRPEHFMPVHGETRQLLANEKIGINAGIKPENIHIGYNGRVLVLTEASCNFAGEVPAGDIFVDGHDIGGVGSIVINDRKILASDGLVLSIITFDNRTKKIVAGPDIVSRGFVYVRESEELIEAIKKMSQQEAQKCLDEGDYDWGHMKQNIKNALSKLITRRTGRSPMILPIIINV